MATTGFWPVKNSLKEVIEYARNPDKTTDPRYLDKDLLNTLQYAANEEKTDERLFVSGINCGAKRAYSRMMATKQRFGKLGGNVAYHGFQSFKTGEVTPEEAHEIGIETAKRMWGDEYEVIVTTHLNTDNLHNHMVVNSVSFKTGRKFENHISDHYKLREISDAICRERNKSVLENSSFYGGEKGAYWAHKNGKLTHRDILKRDIESVLELSGNPQEFESRLKVLGYRFMRTRDKYQHLSVMAPDWKRPIRLDGLGYTKEIINARMQHNREDGDFYYRHNTNPPRRPKQTPLLLLEIEFHKTRNMDGIQIIFALVIELCKILTGNNIDATPIQPLSPSVRMELAKLDQTLKEYKLLCENHIDSYEGLVSFIADVKKDITSLEVHRNAVYNSVRRPKSEEEKEQHKAEARDISAKIKPLREQLRTAKETLEHIPKIKELLETERAMEVEIKSKKKDRGFER
jgi:hypothetical protein